MNPEKYYAPKMQKMHRIWFDDPVLIIIHVHGQNDEYFLIKGLVVLDVMNINCLIISVCYRDHSKELLAFLYNSNGFRTKTL